MLENEKSIENREIHVNLRSGTEFLIVCPRANLGSDADFLTGGLVDREERPR